MTPCTDPAAVMPRRLAYRIENPITGRGPFVESVLSHRSMWEDSATGPYRMPNPIRDKARRGYVFNASDLIGSPAWRCAFPDVATLLRWFEPIDLEVCHKTGYVFKVYAAAWTQHTLYREQIVFNRYHAVCLRTLPIVDTRAWFAPLQADRMAA